MGNPPLAPRQRHPLRQPHPRWPRPRPTRRGRQRHSHRRLQPRDCLQPPPRIAHRPHMAWRYRRLGDFGGGGLGIGFLLLIPPPHSPLLFPPLLLQFFIPPTKGQDGTEAPPISTEDLDATVESLATRIDAIKERL